MALLKPPEMSDLSPQSPPKRTLHQHHQPDHFTIPRLKHLPQG